SMLRASSPPPSREPAGDGDRLELHAREKPLKVGLYACATAAVRDRDGVEQILVDLAAQAARRGWEIALECTDQAPSREGGREGLRRLTRAVRAKAIQAVLVRSLSHLARSLRQLTDLGRLLAAQEVALVAIDDHLDTTDLGGALRW